MNNTKKGASILQILGSLWILYVFLGSLPYKFSGHVHTQHIFGTIGEWMKGFLGQSIGNGFSNFGAYVIGTLELIVSAVLLSAIYFLAKKNFKNADLSFGIGGIGAMFLMIGATFFHLATPLGIEVNGDGGSLFRAAVSILVIGGAMGVYNCRTIREKIKNYS